MIQFYGKQLKQNQNMPYSMSKTTSLSPQSKRLENETEKHQTKVNEKTSGNSEKASNKTRRWTKSHVWDGAIQNEFARPCTLNTSVPSGAQACIDEETQVNSKELDISLQHKGRGYFNSKFNHRKPLSLCLPVSIETENSHLSVNPKSWEAHYEDSKRILKTLQKSQIENNKATTVGYFQRKETETIGEKSIKLARDKNTLPEVILKRHNGTEDKGWCAPCPRLSLGDVEYLREPHARKRNVLAWNACVFPAIFVEFPARKTISSLHLERKCKRVKRNKDARKNALKPTTYTELDCPIRQDQPTEEVRPLSRMLYQSHHGK